jgi:hypothetical protein
MNTTEPKPITLTVTEELRLHLGIQDDEEFSIQAYTKYGSEGLIKVTLNGRFTLCERIKAILINDGRNYRLDMTELESAVRQLRKAINTVWR